MTDDTAPPDPDQADYDQLIGTVGQSLPLQSALQVTNIANQLRQVARRLDEVALRGHDTSRRQRLIEAAQDLEAHVERLNELAPGDEKMAHFLATMDESPLGTPLAKAVITLGQTLRQYQVAMRRVEELVASSRAPELRDVQSHVEAIINGAEPDPQTIRVEPGTLVSGQWRLGALAADIPISCALCASMDWLDRIYHQMTEAVDAGNLAALPELTREARQTMADLHRQLDLIEPNGQHTHADPTGEGPRAVAVTDDGPPASEPQA